MKKFNLMLGMVLLSVLMISLVSAGWFTGNVIKLKEGDSIAQNVNLVRADNNGAVISINNKELTLKPGQAFNVGGMTYTYKKPAFLSSASRFDVTKAPIAINPVGPVLPNPQTITVTGRGNSTNSTNVTTSCSCNKAELLQLRHLLDNLIAQCGVEDGTVISAKEYYIENVLFHGTWVNACYCGKNAHDSPNCFDSDGDHITFESSCCGVGTDPPCDGPDGGEFFWGNANLGQATALKQE